MLKKMDYKITISKRSVVWNLTIMEQCRHYWFNYIYMTSTSLCILLEGYILHLILQHPLIYSERFTVRDEMRPVIANITERLVNLTEIIQCIRCNNWLNTLSYTSVMENHNSLTECNCQNIKKNIFFKQPRSSTISSWNWSSLKMVLNTKLKSTPPLASKMPSNFFPINHLFAKTATVPLPFFLLQVRRLKQPWMQKKLGKIIVVNATWL